MYTVANILASETISDMYQVANNLHNYNSKYAIDGNFYLNRLEVYFGNQNWNLKFLPISTLQ